MTETPSSKIPKFLDFSKFSPGEFRSHINNSILGYDVLIRLLVGYSTYFTKPNGFMLDLGCSDGYVTSLLAGANPSSQVLGVDKAPNFKEDWEGYKRDNLTYACDDITRYPSNNCNFISSVFTLQFVPLPQRLQCLDRIFSHLETGGCFFIAEKTYMDNSLMESMQHSLYYEYKKESFPSDEILEKEITLRSIMKPLPYSDLVSRLESAGFVSVNPVWKTFGFCAFLCIKG